MSITIEWYDVPPFDGGGTSLRIQIDGCIVLHQHYRADLLEVAYKVALTRLNMCRNGQLRNEADSRPNCPKCNADGRRVSGTGCGNCVHGRVVGQCGKDGA